MNEVRQAIVLRLYPAPEQAAALRGWMGCARFVWNNFVAHNKALYGGEKRFDFHARLSALLPGMKRAAAPTRPPSPSWTCRAATTPAFARR
ncbi:MAG: helix-turn-helix domain-containing protein [Geminicoccaceae bacterium]|nr:helix-turn-helix domain-containing protein [Geminicoccaceae bacterium]